MRKSSIVLAITLALSSAFCFAACGGASSDHVHTFDTKWSCSLEEHWHAATCVHTDLRKDAGPHITGPDGKCTACGYQVVGMSVAEFTESNSEAGRNYVRSAVANLNPEDILSEFVWFRTDENNKLIGFTYLYTQKREEGMTPPHIIKKIDYDGIGHIDLARIADGLTAQMGTEMDTGSLIPYDGNGQQNTAELAAKVVSVCSELKGETLNGTVPLCRFFHAVYSASNINLRVVDLLENGYKYYIVKVAGDETETADNAALLAKLDGVTADACTINGKTNLGTLIYQKLGEPSNAVLSRVK